LTTQLILIPEPSLKFRYAQSVEDPHDGLTLFGPLDPGKVHGIRAGVIGTPNGIRRYKKWVKSIQTPIYPPKIKDAMFRPVFPGFQAAFGVKWNVEPEIELTVDSDELAKTLKEDDRHQRVYRTVDLFANRILKAKREEEISVNVWFVVVPPDVKKYCRPMSRVEAEIRTHDETLMSEDAARGFIRAPSLFREANEETIPFQFEPDFHNQLKARLLLHDAPLQVLNEDTIAPEDFVKSNGLPIRRVDAPSTIAWNLCSTVYYKASGRPWKLSRVREGVCYLGLVFKQDNRSPDPLNACCAAQMFLDSGDGVVFKGAVGPWYTGKRGEFHLTKEAAKEVASIAINSYVAGPPRRKPPRELFVHGKVRMNDEEWEGFKEAAGKDTNIVGVRIRQDVDLKLFSRFDYPVPRGTVYFQTERQGYLWTVGFVPRLQTYLGKEVPNPILVQITHGRASIPRVMQDVLALTKLNYNACVFADGAPVTLKFADSVGEILTAGPIGTDTPPLPFKFYI
jgi:hypothetical protein